MPAYIVRSPRWPDPRVKPPYGAAEIDPTHPLSVGITNLWTLNERGDFVSDPVGNLNGTLSGSLATWDGLGVQLNAGDATTSMVSLDQLAFTYPTSTVIAVGVRFLTTDNYGPLIALRSSSTATPVLDVCVGYNGAIDNAGTVQPITRDDSAALIYGWISGSTWTINDGLVHSLVFFRLADGFWRILGDNGGADSDYMGQVSGAFTFTADQQAFGCERNWVSIAYGTADQQYLDGTIITAFISGADWSKDRVLWWHNEPYAMLRPIVRRRYFIPPTVTAAGPAFDSSRAFDGGLTLNAKRAFAA